MKQLQPDSAEKSLEIPDLFSTSAMAAIRGLEPSSV
jgi:hypothetical protein